MSKRGTLFVVTGPSGAGKGTVLHRVFSDMEGIYYSVSATTRAPREGETNGVEYLFITREAFLRLIEQDRLLEHAEYVGNFYGTPADPVNDHLAAGEDVVLEIEIQGALNVRRKRPDAVLIFIAPPSYAELERRLRARGTEDEATILRRTETARRECANMDAFDYVVVNDTVEGAVYEMESIVTACRCRRENRDFILE